METVTSKRALDLTGHTFGRLTVLSRGANKPGRRSACWDVICSCGNTVKSVRADGLRSGATKSCGCLQKENAKAVGYRNLKDLTGQVFGRLTVIRRTEQKGVTRNARWLCQCSCGNPEPVSVSGLKLTSGNTVSCGCYHSQQSAKWTGFLNSEKLDSEFGDEIVTLYLAEVAKRFLKVGIASNMRTRMSVAKAENGGKPYYTSVVKTWRMPRREALAIESVILAQTQDSWDPQTIKLAGIDRVGGRTELREGLASADIASAIDTLAA